MVDATRLAPRLWMGSAPALGTGIADYGFDVLALCAEEYQPRLHNFPGLHTVLHAPLDDGKLTSEQIDTAVETAFAVADHVREGDRVLVTCMAGRNRSGLVAALALHLLTCWHPRDCIAHVRALRKGIDGGAALSNEHFVSFLKTFKVAC